MKNVLVLKNNIVENAIVVEDNHKLDPVKHGGDEFIEDIPCRPAIGWVRNSETEFENQKPALGILEEKIIDGKRVIKEIAIPVS